MARALAEVRLRLGCPFGGPGCCERCTRFACALRELSAPWRLRVALGSGEDAPWCFWPRGAK